jgi:hypothetical protein
MKQAKISVLTSIILLMLGCKAQTATEQPAITPTRPEAASSQATSNVAVTESAAQLLEKKLTKEMPYAELRKIVLAEGWLPLVTPECKENIGGEALICGSQPEVESCSGDGHCNMQFAHGASQARMKVGTYADNTKFWEFSVAAGNENATACPSQKFEDFLKTFASDKTMQKSFTAPLVKVEELVDGDEKGFSMRSVYFNQADYKDFNLAYAKDGYHAVFNDEVGPKPIAVEIKPEAADAYFVKFQYGVSEGNSYRFKNQGGCWQLTEDPEAPSP